MVIMYDRLYGADLCTEEMVVLVKIEVLSMVF